MKNIKTHTVNLEEYPDLIVIYLGMQPFSPRGMLTAIRALYDVWKMLKTKPEGLLRHENMVTLNGFFSLSMSFGFRQYWRNFDDLEKWEKYLSEEIEIECAEDYLKVETEEHDLQVRSDVLPNKELLEAITSLSENSFLIYEGKEIASFKKTANSQPIEYKGEISLIQYPWQIFLENGNEIKKDFEILTKNKKVFKCFINL